MSGDADGDSGGDPAAAGSPAAASSPDAAPVPDAVRDYLDAHEADLVATATRLVGVDTRNPPGRTVEAVEVVEDYLADRGVATGRVVAEADRPNLLASLPGERPATLLLAGHLDTVPFDAAEWTRDPLGERDGDRLYGRGAADMKGPVAAMLAAVAAYSETGTTPPVSLGLALVGDEETAGDAGLRALLSRGAVDADACVVGEPTCDGDRHSVVVADRGSIWLSLSASGTAAHGSRPALGDNALVRLYRAVEAVEAALADRPLDLAPAMAPVVEESVAFYADRMGEAAARATFEHPTVNLGCLRGGESVNTVPESATARLDVRVTASADARAVLAAIRDVVAGREGVEITDVSLSQGTYEPPDSPVVAATVAAAATVAGGRVYRRSATGGGDAKALRSAGVPTVEFAFGPDTAHAVDEYTTVEALRANAAAYARLPGALAAALDGA